MSRYYIEIDDNAVTEQINNILNDIVNRQLRHVCDGSGSVVAEAVKDIVYSRKDEIIEKCVERASRELVKRGLPKLLEKADG